MMKKTVSKFLTATILLSVGTTCVFAAGLGQNQTGSEGKNGIFECAVNCFYTDADGDGICDDYASGICGRYYTDADGDGICDNYASGVCGRYYTDADGDGICDNYASGVCARGGAGRGNGFRRRCGR